MPVVRFSLPIPIPNWLYRPLRKVREAIVRPHSGEKTSAPRIPNLEGDRDIEWTWIQAQIPNGSGQALDFGTGSSHLALHAALCGYHVLSIDLLPVERWYTHPRIEYRQMDLLKAELPEAFFDLVLNCSTIEHVGLSGRYGVTESIPDGDIQAMRLLQQSMKPGALMLMTIPVGLDRVFQPLCRVYGERRLPMLIQGFTALKQDFWMKDDANRWLPSSQEAALKSIPSAGAWDYRQNFYALGCFVLRKE
jgi:hypothetical protein